MTRQANFLHRCAPSALLLAYACASCNPGVPTGAATPAEPGSGPNRVRVLSAHATVEMAPGTELPVDWSAEETARIFTSNFARPIWDLQNTPDSIGAHVLLNLQMVPPDTNHPQAIVHIESSVTSSGSTTDEDSVSSEVSVDLVFDSAQWQQDPELVIRRALARVADTLTACVELQLGDDAGLSDALSRPDPAVAQCAIVEATERNVALPAQRLLPHLQQNELPSLALAVIGHAAATHQNELAAAVIERIPARDPEFLVAALPALARFESDEVIGYIRAVAEAHPNADVRAFAASWLQ